MSSETVILLMSEIGRDSQTAVPGSEKFLVGGSFGPKRICMS